MDDKSNSKNSSEHTNILDLHECIFREIFDYVDHHELYFTVRSVGRVLKSYVESYIELGGEFVLAPRSPETPIEVLYIFKKKSKPVSSCSRLLPPLPHPGKDHNKKSPVHYLRTFGAMIKGNLIIGVYCKHGYIDVYAGRIPCFQYFFWKFDQDKLEWLPIKPEGKQNDLPYADAACQYYPMASCAFEDTILILEHVEVVNPNWIIPYRYHNNLRRFVFNVSSDKNDNSNKNYSTDSNKTKHWKKEFHISSYNTSIVGIANIGSGIKMDQDLNQLSGTNMLQIDDKTFVLYGGKKERYGDIASIPMMYKTSYFNIDIAEKQKIYPTTRFQEFEINHEVFLRPSDLKMYKRPILFKIKDSIFIGGAFCPSSQSQFASHNLYLHCDQIDIHDGVMNTPDALPYYVDSCDGNALTDEQETFALISREYLGRTLIFTEKDGFHELPNTNYDETWKNYHLRDREKECLPKMPLLRIR